MGGEDLTFIVDTGAEAAMTVHKTVADNHGGPPIRAVTINHTTDGTVHRMPDARLGKIGIPAGEATAIDLSTFQWTTGLPIAGVIGWPSLKGKSLAIDHEKKVFQIWEGKAAVPELATTLPIKEEQGLPHITAKIGATEVSILIDTGDNGSISLIPTEFERLVGEGWIKPSPNVAHEVGVGGGNAVQSGSFTRGTLFGVHLKGMHAASTSSGRNTVGLEFLLKLNIRISNSPSLFSYSLRTSPETPINPNRMSGMFLIFRDGHGVVAKLKPGGQGRAEKAGLMLKDEIVSIDELAGKPLDVLSWYQVCRRQAGKTLTLHILRQGSAKTITLELGAATSTWEPESAKADDP